MPAKNILPLTSLRFVAAAMILILHSRGYFGIPRDWARDAPLYHGVSFFFVLSGFILTYAYPSLPDREAVRRFWVARFARLWPVHIFAALLFIAANPWVLDSLKSPLGLMDAALFVSLLQSWVPLEVVFFSYNAVSWSVSCEVLFYLVFPLLIAGWVRTWPWKLALVALLAGSMLAIGYGISAPFHGARDQVTLDGLVYISPFTRLVEFALGMAAALLFKRIPEVSRRTATVAELGALAFVGWSMTFGPMWFYLGPPHEAFGAPVAFFLQRTWCAPAFAVLIASVALQRGVTAKVLSSAPLVLLGEISYVMYLTHQTLLSLCQRWLAGVPPALAYVTFLVALLAFSWAVWRYFEAPCRNWIRDAYARRAARPAQQGCVGSQVSVSTAGS